MREIKFINKHNNYLQISTFDEIQKCIKTIKVDMNKEYEVKNSILYQNKDKIFEFENNEELRQFYSHITKKDIEENKSFMIFTCFIMTLFSIIVMFSMHEYFNYKNKYNVQQNNQLQLKQQELLKKALLPSLLENSTITPSINANTNGIQSSQPNLSLEMLNELGNVDNLPDYLKPQAKIIQDNVKQTETIKEQDKKQVVDNGQNSLQTNKVNDNDFLNEIRDLKK